MAHTVSVWKMMNAPPREVDDVVTILRQGLTGQNPPHDVNQVRAKRLLGNWLASQQSGTLVAKDETDGSIVGVIACRKEAPAMRVIYLAAKFGREGIGSSLMERVIEQARTDGLSEVRGTYSPLDKAHVGFLKKHRFDPGTPIRMVCGVEHHDAVLKLQ